MLAPARRVRRLRLDFFLAGLFFAPFFATRRLPALFLVIRFLPAFFFAAFFLVAIGRLL